TTVNNFAAFTGALPNQTVSRATGPLNLTLTGSDPEGSALGFGAVAGTQGYVLQTIYNLRFGGSYYLNSVGLNEKWVKGDTNAYNDPWYFLLPTGQFYAWNGVSNAAGALRDPATGGTLAPLATLDQPTLYWTNPQLLYQNTAYSDL